MTRANMVMLFSKTSRFRNRPEARRERDAGWLQPAPLIAMIAALSSVIVALVLVFQLSRQEKGFTIHVNNHFTWTYGPTAVLILLVAFWRQIDMSCKIITPWAELSKGDCKPQNGVLLDYTSLLQVVSLYEAVKNQHGGVIVTMTGFVVLKLVTLVSTGLLFADQTALSGQGISIMKATQLDGRLYDPSTNPGLFDPSLTYTAYAVMVNGLRHPEGTTADLVYEELQVVPDAKQSNSTFTGLVNALVPRYYCESAPAAIKRQPANVTDIHPEDSIQLLFPECTLRRAGEGTPVYALNPQVFVCPERQLSPLLQQIDCIVPPGLEGDQNWQLLTLADYRYEQTFMNESGLEVGDSNVRAASWSTTVQQVTSIACRSAFTVESVEVTYDFSASPPWISAQRIPQEQITNLENFTMYDLGVLTTSALMAGAGMFGNLVDNEAAFEYPNALFKMMAHISGGTYESLLDESTMITAAETVLGRVAIQAASKYLTLSENSTIPGKLETTEERLQVSELAVFTMLGACTLLVALTLALLFIRPRATCSDNPTLSTIARVLAYSPKFNSLITLQTDINAGLASGLKDSCFRATKTRGHLEIYSSSSAEEIDAPAQRASSDPTVPKSPPWWTQVTLQVWMLFLTLLVPIAVLAALELLQQMSDRNSGLSTLSAGTSGLTVTVYTRYIPALAMLLIATSVNTLDFNVSLLAPFSVLLAKTGSPPSRTLNISFLGLPSPVVIWKACTLGHWNVVFSTTGALVASTLTIVVSGLYTIEHVGTTERVSVTRVDHFNTSWSNSVLNDSSAAVLASLTESLGLEYPAFTFEEYALPTLESNLSSAEISTSNASVNLAVLALRSDLECVKLTEGMMNISATFNGRIKSASASVFARAPLPPDCLLGGPGGNLSDIEFTTTFALRGNSSFVGKLLDLHVGPFDALFASSSGELSPNKQADNPPGCPSLAFIYGHADANIESATSITALMCYQYISEVGMNVTMQWPSLAVSSSQPPIADEASARRQPSGSNGETAFQFRLQLHMDDEFSSFNQSSDNTSTTAGSAPPLDNFFQGVLFGKTPIDPDLLRSTDAADAARVSAGIQGLYRRYMAQAISSNMRVTVPQAAAPGAELKDNANTLEGTLFNAAVARRVVQNRTTKVILQVQLGAVFLLTSLAMYFTKLRKVLLYNPCCIAGLATLFSRSKMCDLSCAVGQEIMADDGIGLRDGRWLFRLGWWDAHGMASDAATGRWYGIDAIPSSSQRTGAKDSNAQDAEFPAWI